MSGNYAEIVELRGSILRAIMKKNRGELTREIKRGERLKNNGALGLLLNVARLTLDMFQERNRMKKRLLDLTETIEKHAETMTFFCYREAEGFVTKMF